MLFYSDNGKNNVTHLYTELVRSRKLLPKPNLDVYHHIGTHFVCRCPGRPHVPLHQGRFLVCRRWCSWEGSFPWPSGFFYVSTITGKKWPSWFPFVASFVSGVDPTSVPSCPSQHSSGRGVVVARRLLPADEENHLLATAGAGYCTDRCNIPSSVVSAVSRDQLYVFTCSPFVQASPSTGEHCSAGPLSGASVIGPFVFRCIFQE